MWYFAFYTWPSLKYDNAIGLCNLIHIDLSHALKYIICHKSCVIAGQSLLIEPVVELQSLRMMSSHKQTRNITISSHSRYWMRTRLIYLLSPWSPPLPPLLLPILITPLLFHHRVPHLWPPLRHLPLVLLMLHFHQCSTDGYWRPATGDYCHVPVWCSPSAQLRHQRASRYPRSTGVHRHWLHAARLVCDECWSLWNRFTNQFILFY